jgi:hypothetical protein
MPAHPDSIRHLANEVASEIEAQYGAEAQVRAALVVSVELDFAREETVKRVIPAEMQASELAELASLLTKDA